MLVRTLGFLGLALSTSMAAIANGFWLVWLLRQRLGGLDGNALTVALAKITVAAAAMAFAAIVIERSSFFFAGGEAFTFQIIRLGLSIAGALVVLVAIAKILRISEFDEMLTLARVRARKLLDV
jgi:peptidoglycan biosynthesis protein MviN/MurJ (putative lipid II flippase)